MPNTHASHLKYRADIDGLRAIAVLIVVVFHAFPQWLPGGFVGVDIFFIISGFLISMIIIKGLASQSWNLRDFYSRRIKRIFPALSIVLISTYAIGWLYLFPDEFKLLGKHIAAGTGFVSNLVLWSESGYFDTLADTKPLLHLWSLGIEEQFYLLWPLLLWVTYVRKWNLFVVVGSTTFISFILNVLLIADQPVMVFYSPLTRLWELSMGSLLALFAYHKTSFPKALSKNIVAGIGLSLIFTALLLLNKTSAFPGWWALLPTLGTCLLIHFAENSWINKKILSHKFLVGIGQISYPLYLWHWPLLSLARTILGDVNMTPVLTLITCLLSFVLAWLTFIFIEKPLRFSLSIQRVVIFLLVLMILIGSLGWITFLREGHMWRIFAQKTEDFNFDNRTLGFSFCPPSLQGSPHKVDFCFQRPNKVANIALLGDSHALDKYYGLATLDTQRQWLMVGNGSCPPLLGVVVEREKRFCDKKWNFIAQQILNMPEVKTVVLSFYGLYFTDSLYAADHVKTGLGPNTIKIYSEELPNASRKDAFYYGLKRMLATLREKKHVILVLDIPELPFFPKECYRTGSACLLSTMAATQRRAPHQEMIKQLQGEFPELLVFDPLEFFCNDEQCLYETDDALLYRDSHHLGWKGSLYYGKHFLQWLNHQTHHD